MCMPDFFTFVYPTIPYPMKKLLLISLILLTPVAAHSQLFNAGKSLGTGRFALGVNPTIFAGGPSDGLNLFLHGGVGLKPGIDLALKFGIGRTSYYEANLEWGLAKYFSLTTGLHHFGDFGLDGALNVSFPIRNDTRLYTGIDMDLVFASQLRAPFWIPVGVELGLRNNLSFILEGEIGLNPEAYHVLDLGVNIYF